MADPAPQTNQRQKLSADKEAAHFFALAFLFTFGLQGPGVFAKFGLLPGGIEPYLPFVMLGVLGPLMAAVLLAQKSGGREARRELFRPLFRGRPSVLWLLLALVAPGLLLFVGLIVGRAFGHDGPLTYFPPPERIVVAVVISLGEEVGWRGYALPRLAQRFGRVPGSVLLGVLWTLWHVPMFLGADVSLTLLPVMIVFFVSGSIVFSWFYFRTGQSLLVAVLLHLGSHLNNSHLALPGDSSPLLAHALAFFLCAVALCLLDRETLFPPRR